MSIRVRAATVDDAARCADIYAPYATDTWISFELDPPSADEMAQRIKRLSLSHSWLVAEQSGAIIGYAYGSPHRSREAYQSSCDVAVYTDRDWHGRGAGSALYANLLPQLAERFHAAFAGIALPNEASIALHRKMQFEPVGDYREVGFKLGEWLDVSWWQRLL